MGAGKEDVWRLRRMSNENMDRLDPDAPDPMEASPAPTGVIFDEAVPPLLPVNTGRLSIPQRCRISFRYEIHSEYVQFASPTHLLVVAGETGLAMDSFSTESRSSGTRDRIAVRMFTAAVEFEKVGIWSAVKVGVDWKDNWYPNRAGIGFGIEDDRVRFPGPMAKNPVLTLVPDVGELPRRVLESLDLVASTGASRMDSVRIRE